MISAQPSLLPVPRLLFRFAVLFSVVGCAAPDTNGTDSGTGGDGTGGDGASTRHSTAVVATVANDYSVGTLATISLDDWTVTDEITVLSSDPAVVADEGKVVQLNRFNTDTVRLYEPGQWEAPTWELALEDGANPVDARICADRLFISPNNGASLPVYDPETGLLVGAVDLSDFDDGDGTPEPSTMVRRGDRLLVALNQLDQDNGWLPDGGTVVTVDCDTLEVTDAVEVGANPTLSDWPGGDHLILRTGAWRDAAGDFAYDGMIALFDPATGEIGPALMDEALLQLNLSTAAAPASGQAIVIATDADWTFSVHCLDLHTGEHAVLETRSDYLAAVAMSDQGQAWVAARPGWSDTSGTGGVLVYDAESCASLTGSAPISTVLPPYNLALY